jgi:Glyoxalase-like domain
VQLDHLFAFIDPRGRAVADLDAKGLAVSYRRDHIGQGTANTCFVFDNAFLELLWLTSETQARSRAITRTKLWERSPWQTAGTCLYGLAWRGDVPEIETWPLCPPYLPEGIHIPVATDSDDPRLPMMFTFPGSSAPRDWSAERRAFTPHPGGWNQISGLELTLPIETDDSRTLATLCDHLNPSLSVIRSERYSLKVELCGVDGEKQDLVFE